MSSYLIVGASSGIGKTISELLVSEGNAVTGTYYKHAQGNSSFDVNFRYLNVLDETFPADLIPEKLDGVVYCPGSINLRPFERIRHEDFLADYKLQVIGATKVLQAAMPVLKKAEHPSIVLFSTVAVQTGFPYHTQVSASKGAIEGLTRALAAEFAPKIRVNCIAPSLTDTPLASALLNTDAKREANALRHPLKRIGTPGNIADLALFLLSPKSSWITGQILHIDGGMSAIRV